MEVYGTHFRTLLGMRRLLSSLETSKMKSERMDKLFLMTMDWLKSYGRRADLMAKYSVSKRGFDVWREQIIGRLVTVLPWVSACEQDPRRVCVCIVG